MNALILKSTEAFMLHTSATEYTADSSRRSCFNQRSEDMRLLTFQLLMSTCATPRRVTSCHVIPPPLFDDNCDVWVSGLGQTLIAPKGKCNKGGQSHLLLPCSHTENPERCEPM